MTDRELIDLRDRVRAEVVVPPTRPAPDLEIDRGPLQFAMDVLPLILHGASFAAGALNDASPECWSIACAWPRLIGHSAIDQPLWHVEVEDAHLAGRAWPLTDSRGGMLVCLGTADGLCNVSAYDPLRDRIRSRIPSSLGLLVGVALPISGVHAADSVMAVGGEPTWRLACGVGGPYKVCTLHLHDGHVRLVE